MRASARSCLGVLPLVLLAVPGVLSAQPTVAVDPGLAVERSQVCRETTAALNEVARSAADHGWTELRHAPGDEATGRSAEFEFERDNVRLFLRDFNPAQAECSINALMPEAVAWTDVLAAATTGFGRAPTDTSGTYARWVSLDDHKITIRLTGRFFSASIQPARAAPALAWPSSMQGAPAAEIAAAAVACIAALDGRRMDAAEIPDAGWRDASESRGVMVYARAGSTVRIFEPRSGEQCIVDAYGERRDGFDAIRDAIMGRLTERFGAHAAFGQAIGEADSFSRGQGFTIGHRIGVLSSEQRPNGLSIRFTVMNTR